MILTPRLGLQKPDPNPVTGDFVDISVLNANMDKIDAVISATVCTSGTRPGSPYDGQIIRETDTGRVYIRNATAGAWDPVLISRGTISTPGGAGSANANLRFDLASGSILTSYFVASKQAADSFYRYAVAYDGWTEWGSGAAAADTNLYRRAANHLGTDDSFQATGYCSGLSTENVRVAASAAITTTETVIQSVTFNAITNVQYMVHATQHFQSTVAGDQGLFRLRYAAGASVTTAGTQLTALLTNADIAAKVQPIAFHKRFVAPSTGQFTVGVTLIRNGAGTGNLSSFGSASAENVITVVGA